MADLNLERPQAGQRVEYSDLADARILLGFPSDEAVLERQDDSLVFTFEDNSTIVLQDFYNAFTRDTLPEFTIDGQVVSGEDFFAALGDETLMPAAGPAQQAADGNRYRSYSDLGLYDGIDRLDGLDLGWQWGDEPEEDLWGLGERGTDPDPVDAVTPVNLSPTVRNFVHNVYEDGHLSEPALPTTATGYSLTGSIAGDGIHSFVWGEQQGEYGQFVMNPDGTYEYILNNDDPRVQGLKDGESYEEEFTFTYIDEDGDSATGTITIIVNGKNDAPEIASSMDLRVREDGVKGDDAAIVGEDANSAYGGVLMVTGSVTATDADFNDTMTFSVVQSSGNPGSGSNTSTVIYTEYGRLELQPIISILKHPTTWLRALWLKNNLISR